MHDLTIDLQFPRTMGTVSMTVETNLILKSRGIDGTASTTHTRNEPHRGAHQADRSLLSQPAAGRTDRVGVVTVYTLDMSSHHPRVFVRIVAPAQ